MFGAKIILKLASATLPKLDTGRIRVILVREPR